MTVTVSAFYKFVVVADPNGLRDALFEAMTARELKGTILVAHEGINGTISGAPGHIASFMAQLRADPRFADLATKDATANGHPFHRLKVKLKPEIVTIRAPEADPTRQVGTYVDPQDWNALISDPGVLVLDTRNIYEVEQGTFEGAVDPGLDHFTQWPEFVTSKLGDVRDKKIAMFCTGGIRCEKASAYMLAHGFAEVYHLKGGILNYLAKVPEAESLWRGKCYVFDERGSVDKNSAGSGEGPGSG
jgi:UPF0176 protein